MIRSGDPARRRRIELGLVWAILLALQGGATLAALDRSTYEELAESVRNPFWLDEHTIYDGASSNIGWYALCLFGYKLFGFSISFAKGLRLGLDAIALWCVLLLVSRALPGRTYILPALAIGLSPTMLYFNTYQTSYGSDLLFAPIVLCCLLAIPSASYWRSLALHALAGATAMLAAMSYPGFLFYLPFGFVLLGMMHHRMSAVSPSRAVERRRSIVAAALAASLAATLLLAVSILWLKDPSRLFFDSRAQAGIFRGGGGPVTLRPRQVFIGIRTVLDDLFVSGTSYYFPLDNVEFGGWLGRFAVAATIAAVLVLLVRRPRERVPLATALAMIPFGLVASNLASFLPGLRRSTVVLFAFYALVVLALRAVGSDREPSVNRWVRALPLSALMALLLHHGLAYPGVLRELQAEAKSTRASWLRAAPTPAEALDFWVSRVESSGPISCGREALGVLPECRFAEFYAAIAGYERWSRGREVSVVVVNPRSGEPMELSVNLWDTYQLDH